MWDFATYNSYTSRVKYNNRGKPVFMDRYSLRETGYGRAEFVGTNDMGE
ncbi:MAG: hypothetical protein LBT78_10835 [Tannerella sp.]|nr:hypothetical protein [Tannerella sp.]